MTRKLKLKHFTSFIGMLCLAAAIGGRELQASHYESSQRGPADVLNRRELFVLESVAWRVQSMMAMFEPVTTRVWPHGVRDQLGRQGIFIGSHIPLFGEENKDTAAKRRAWVVCGLIAAVKYAEGS